MPTLLKSPGLEAMARLVALLIPALTMTACVQEPAARLRAPSTAMRNLPGVPKLLTKAQPLPHLDADCRFPWFRVAGCRGKDPAAMLRLTVSDDLEVRNRLNAVPGWYEGVRKSYGAK